MLDKFFDMDNPLMQSLQAAAYLMILNILTILFSIPVISAGAALTAQYDVLRAMARREENYPARMFVHSFKKNLRQGILMGLVFLAAAAGVLSHYFLTASLMPAFRSASLTLVFLLLAVSAYAFPLLARFENTIAGTLKNALCLMIGYFPRTLGIIAFTAVFYFLVIRFPALCAPLVFMFGISLPCYIGTIILDPVLKTMENNT